MCGVEDHEQEQGVYQHGRNDSQKAVPTRQVLEHQYRRLLIVVGVNRKISTHVEDHNRGDTVGHSGKGAEHPPPSRNEDGWTKGGKGAQTHLRKVTASCNQCVEFRVAQRVPVPCVLVCDTGMNE